MALSATETLRETALHHDPACVTACADVEAWDRAEGLASDAAGAAIRRTDVERLIPGLSARGTYKAIGRVVVAAVIVDIGLSYLPRSDGVDMLDSVVRYSTAILGVAVAGWSLLSEVRGWDGSDAATWFAKARIDRTWKKLDARRRALSETLIAVGEAELVIYRSDDGRISRDVFGLDAIVGLSLDAGASHMAVCLKTSDGISRFDWLPRDAIFEAAVTRLAGLAPERMGSGLTATV